MEGHKSLWRVDGTGEWMGICRQVLVSYLLNMIHIRPACTETNKMVSPLYSSAIPETTGGYIWTSTHISNNRLNCSFVQFNFCGFRQGTPQSSNTVTRSHFVTYLLITTRSKNFLKNLTVAQLFKKFPTFYDTGWFITVLITSCKLVPVLSHVNPIHILRFCKFYIHLSIIIPFTVTSRAAP